MRQTPLGRGKGSSLKRSPLKKGNSPLSTKSTLKQGKPLQAKTPLKSNSSLSPGDKPLQAKSSLSSGNKPLQSKSSLKPGDKQLKSNSTLSSGDKKLKSKSAIKAKPKAKTPEEIKCRKIVKERSGGLCEICGQREATDMAHRLAVSQVGKWEPCNILHACRFCHSDNHDHPQRSFDNGWHLRSGSNPIECAVLLAGDSGEKGWFYLKNNGEKVLIDKDSDLPLW